MPLYRVMARVVQMDHYLVEADDEKKAIEEIYQHAAAYAPEYTEYSHALPVETWTAELETKPCPLCGLTPQQCRCKEPIGIGDDTSGDE